MQQKAIIMESVNTALCDYQAIDKNSHRFILQEGNREAVKAWAHQLEQLQLARQWYNTGHVKLLLDARQATELPIRNLFETLSDYNRSYPDLEAPRVSLAYLRNPDTPILEIYQMMAELFEPPLSVQFFLEEDKALRWLQEAG
jgi:hypothetical protein